MSKKVMPKQRFVVRIVGIFAVLVAMLAVSAAAPVRAQDEEAAALLDQAVATMAEVQSFRFELSTIQGESIIFNNLELAGVEGAVQRPDRFQATITARVAVIEVDVRIVGIGERLWVTDPLADTEEYIEVTREVAGAPIVNEALTALVNPDEILLAAVGLVREPELAGTETIDGVRTTRVSGTVDLRDLPQFNRAMPVASGEFLALEEMPITIWIDAKGRVLGLELEGPITADESPDVVRRLDITDIDEPVDIDQPAGR